MFAHLLYFQKQNFFQFQNNSQNQLMIRHEKNLFWPKIYFFKLIFLNLDAHKKENKPWHGWMLKALKFNKIVGPIYPSLSR